MYICKILHLCGLFASHTFKCAAWPIRLYVHIYISIYICDMTHSCGSCVSCTFTCATWLINLYIHTYIHYIWMYRYVYVRMYTYIIYVSNLYVCVCIYVYVRIPCVYIIYRVYWYCSYMYVCTRWNNMFLIPMSHVTHINEWLVYLRDRTHSRTQHRVREHQWVTWHM